MPKRRLIEMKGAAARTFSDILARAPQRVVMNQKLPGARCEIKNAADGTPEMYLYGDIAYYDISAIAVQQQLAAVKDAPNLRVHINSPGGDVFEGIAIHNLIAAHPAAVEMTVDGWAASAASFICMAGDTCVMQAGAMMMIHNAWGMTIGNAADHTAMAETLGLVDKQIAGLYAAKTGLSMDELATMMDAETWMDGQTCVDKGFATSMSEKPAAKAMARAGLYRNAPQSADAEEWKCDPATDLPIDEADSWDGPSASERMLQAAGFDDGRPDAAKAKRGFLAFDASNPGEKGSYKLPFADVINGRLTAMEGGLRAAASRLPQTDIPDAVKTKARGVLDDYFKRRDDAATDRAATLLAEQNRRWRLMSATL